MTDRSSDDRLLSERNVWLTTVRADGRPHLIPIWFVYVRSTFWIGTALRSVKTRNIAANPSVSVALEDATRPVAAEGTAVVHLYARPQDVLDAFTAKYDWDMTETEDPDMGTVVLLEITPRHWLFGRPDGWVPNDD